MSKKIFFYYFDHDGLSLKYIQQFYRIKSQVGDKITMIDISAIEHASAGGEFPAEVTRFPAIVIESENSRSVLLKPELIDELFGKLASGLTKK